MHDKVNILGVKIDKYNIPDAAEKIYSYLHEDGTKAVYTPNSEIVMMAYRDDGMRDILNSADMLTADGIGVVYASKILKNPISERAAGYDIARELLKKLAKDGGTLYLFGSKPGVADAARENLEKEYEGINIVGISDGYFDAEKEKQIIDDINAKKPDVLFVCLGAPKQEKWIHDNKDRLNVKVCMGLGGCLDVFAGNVKRAPDFFVKLGIEWLYRLAKEPKRIGRMMDLPRFAMTVIKNGKKYEQGEK